MTGRMTRITRVAFAVSLIACCAVAASAADVVILKDGFVIQGRMRKEIENVFDKASGRAIPIVKANGLDMIDEGAKVTVFSTHAKQLGEAKTDVKLRSDVKAFTMPFAGQRGINSLAGLGATLKVTEFNSKWVRTLTVTDPRAAPAQVEQQITYMDPYFIYMISATHRWRLTYRTSEWDPQLIRKLLMMHPEIEEPDNKCDPLKRIMLARFMLDAGWLQFAKDEVKRLQADFKGEMTKDAKEQFDTLQKDIDHATAELVVGEAELALAAGRYKYAAELLSAFPEKTAATKEVARAAKVTAELKDSKDRYDTGRKLLRELIDEVLNLPEQDAFVSVGGGLAIGAWTVPKKSEGMTRDLALAAERVYVELHPDSSIRIDLFIQLATDYSKTKQAGRKPTKQPAEVLATAVSGWARGKNGATPNAEAAWKLWQAREIILAYQRADEKNDRTALLKRFATDVDLRVDLVAQMISMLPPADPEDLDDRRGDPVPLGSKKDSGVYRRTTPALSGQPNGIDYLVKLPPEYHHGRAYPVLIVLTHAGISADQILTSLANDADKNGYIIIVPEWTGVFGDGWQWKGEDHVWVTGALRDATRHFTVDNDRVFMLGVGEGANMALDIGMSHPDLFAGIIPVGPTPKWLGMFMEYWRNAQKLPVFTVSGELSSDGIKGIRSIYEKWTQLGYPAIWSIYLGRGLEWYIAEVPVYFDWMSRKTRVSGTATLALGTGTAARQPWQMIRETDNRFYWLQADTIVTGKSGGQIVPATMIGDIRNNNLIDIQVRGVKEMTIWLSADMIPDWKRPIRVQVNGAIPHQYPRQGKVLEPDLEVLLEDYYLRGDRKMLFLNKLKLTKIP